MPNIRRGAAPKPRPFTVRELTRDDLASLEGPRRPRSTDLATIRQSHHMVARYAAMGLRQTEIAKRTGYTRERVSKLLGSPAMQELVQHYIGRVNDAFDESMDQVFDLATNNMLVAERQLADKLAQADEEDELLPTRDLLSIFSDRADRFGYGKKTTNLNVNIDFAARMEQAIRRSGVTINQPTVRPPHDLPSGAGEDRSPTTSLPPPLPFRRRA